MNIQATQRFKASPAIDRGSIPWFINTSWFVMITAAMLQLAFWGSVENLFAIVCVLLAWHLSLTYLLRFNRLRRFALSSFLILGFSITQYFMPLVFTLVEGKPLIYNLKLPYDVFVHSLLSLMVLLFSHAIYTYTQKGSSGARRRIQSLLARTAFFTPPTNRQIWIMGFLGIVSMFYIYFMIGGGGTKQGETGNKFLQGLIPFSYLPFFIPLQRLYNPNYRIKKKLVYQLIAFTVLLFVISLGRNSRSSFMLGFTAVGLGYFLGLILGKFNHKILTPKKIILASICFWVITGPLSDLGVAMVVVRTHRGHVSSEELLMRTLETYQDKDALLRYKSAADEKNKIADWDERYFDNIFLSRFCNLKYNDATLQQAYKLGHVDEKMRDYSFDVLWSTFPQPVLSLFNINVNKQAVTAGSFGDYLYYRATGNAFGGFRTGQFAGTGMAAFGWWYLLLLGVGIGIVYFLLDLFVVYTNDPKTSYISLAGLSSITSIFMFLSLSGTSESVINPYTYILRGWIQLAILYAAVFFIARRIDSLFNRT